MPPAAAAALLLLLATAAATPDAPPPDDDLTFEPAGDLEAELGAGPPPPPPPAVAAGAPDAAGRYRAAAGKVFDLVVPRDRIGFDVADFEAKQHTNKGLPSWLLFDKKTGIFWGVPLSDDIGTLRVTVRPSGRKTVKEELVIVVKEATNEDIDTKKCPDNEDITILSLLLDKDVHAIKPKQRVIAIHNIAKFLGIPYSAFTLNAQHQEDDITDSSVILAGPGNVSSRSSKIGTLLEVPVGCGGRVRPEAASTVHGLRRQALDGTAAEVVGVPVVGWRVRTVPNPASPPVRRKRAAGVDLKDDMYDGSGDYDNEYYYDNEDYDDEDDDYKAKPSDPQTPRPVEKPTTSSTSTTPSTTTTTTTTTTTETPSTHPHRHHHGEINPSAPEVRDHHPHQSTKMVPSTEEITTPSTTTSTTTTKPVTHHTTATEVNPTEEVPVKKVEVAKNNVVPSTYEEYVDYDDDGTLVTEDDDDDDEESETVVPEPAVKHTIPTFEDTESITTEDATTKTTAKEIIPESTIPSTTSTTTSTTTPTTTTTTTETPSTVEIVEDTEPVTVYLPEYSTESPTTVVAVTTTSTTTQATVNVSAVTEAATPSEGSTTVRSAATTTAETETAIVDFTTTQEDTTTAKATTSSVRQAVTLPTTTKSAREAETVSEEYVDRNYKPFIENRLKHMSVTAGKIFRFVIPSNTFKDAEDGYNLTLQLLDINEQPITRSSWLQFNSNRRELYGLPLEGDVSKWDYIIRAVDKDGEYDQDRLVVQVQQHKLDRVVNHEFTLQIRIEKQLEFPHYIDWSLRVLRTLGKIYNTNMSEITVRHINHTSEPVVFTWSNDSIATNYCPRSEIEQLYKILTANDRGDPSRELNLALAPELRVKKVLHREIGVCEQQPLAPVTPPTNFSPILRNPVDKVNATVGELLIYKVPDDTFYDPEDTDSRMLNISLLTSDRQPIPPTNWLQFDSKNREFFGIPRKPGRTEYHLVCVDSGGLPATDSLEVVVYPPPKKHYNVEFSMTIEVAFDTFANSASMQKKFVEKLMELFEESSTDNFHFHPFKQKYDSTIITWFNKSLPVDKCAVDEVKRLESILRNDELRIASQVTVLMEPEFPVSTIKVHLIGNCKSSISKVIPPAPAPTPENIIPVEETTPASTSNEYLVTFIVPAVIISIMLFLAAIAACVLYRRRRSGKMNVEEDGRTSYGNKGIPVIFQEELEEKPEPGTKAPVILKDEKPPLAPPEYSKGGAPKPDDQPEPYQPPPPFARPQDANGRQPRPKPTPTYRKPPPYVPP